MTREITFLNDSGKSVKANIDGLTALHLTLFLRPEIFTDLINSLDSVSLEKICFEKKKIPPGLFNTKEPVNNNGYNLLELAGCNLSKTTLHGVTISPETMVRNIVTDNILCDYVYLKLPQKKRNSY